MPGGRSGPDGGSTAGTSAGAENVGRGVALFQLGGLLYLAVPQLAENVPGQQARHPGMHRTDTLDMFTVAYGEIYLVTDTDATLLQPGDTAVVKGVNHVWANRYDKPCMIIGVMVDAIPLPADVYPAPGL